MKAALYGLVLFLLLLVFAARGDFENMETHHDQT
jgi:hypothetical protein